MGKTPLPPGRLQMAVDALRTLTEISWEISRDGNSIVWNHNMDGYALPDSRLHRLTLLKAQPLYLQYNKRYGNRQDLIELDIPARWFTEDKIVRLEQLALGESQRKNNGPRAAQLVSLLTDIPWEFDGDNVRTLRPVDISDSHYKSTVSEPLKALGVELVYLQLKNEALQRVFIGNYDIDKMEQAAKDMPRTPVTDILGPGQSHFREKSSEQAARIVHALEILTGVPWNIDTLQGLFAEFPDKRLFTSAEWLRVQHVAWQVGMMKNKHDMQNVMQKGQSRKICYVPSVWNPPVRAGEKYDFADKLALLADAEAERRKIAAWAVGPLEIYTDMRWIWDGLNLRSSGPVAGGNVAHKLRALQIPHILLHPRRYWVPLDVLPDICLINDCDRERLIKAARGADSVVPDWARRIEKPKDPPTEGRT